MTKRLAAVALACGLFAAGCGGNDKGSSSSSTTTATTAGGHHMSAGPDSGASELRSGLTAQLQEHVYLAGIAVSQGVAQGLDSGEFKAAASTLDANSQALADSIGSVYGDGAGKQFLALWRKHIGFFVDYTKGKATKDKALVAQAKKNLDGYRTDFGAFIASANPNLPADAVAAELKPHIQTLEAAIDSAVAGKSDVFDKLRTAADHMPMTAQILAAGIVKQYPSKFGS
jgi:cytochrome c556